MPNLQHALAALSDTLTEQTPPAKVIARFGVVASVASGAAADGSDVVTVTVGGDSIPAPRLASYTSPAAGDRVAVLLINSSPLILGRVTGVPTF